MLLLKEIDIVIEMIKDERPDETQLFLNWMRVIFNEKHENIYHEIKHVEEIRTMFATKLEKYGEKLKKEAMQEGMHRKAIQTAKSLLAKNMNIQEISEITGLSVEEIEGLK